MAFTVTVKQYDDPAALEPRRLEIGDEQYADTLVQARDLALRELGQVDAGAFNAHTPAQDHSAEQIAELGEDGATIGPLPDRHVICVARRHPRTMTTHNDRALEPRRLEDVGLAASRDALTGTHAASARVGSGARPHAVGAPQVAVLHPHGYASGVGEKTVIALNVDRIDETTLAAAGLRVGQPVVAEATDRGVLLRAAAPDEIADEDAAARKIADVARRYPGTLERLGR